MKTKALLLASVLILGWIGSTGWIRGASGADRPIYRYTDQNGTTVFTDNLAHVPEAHRSSVAVVELPPAMKIPEASPPPSTGPAAPPIFSWERFEAWPWEYRLAFGAILPTLILTVGVMSFIRKRSDRLWVKLSLRLGMLAIVFLSAYLCYFLLIRIQAGRVIGTVPGGAELLTAPREVEDRLIKREEERWKRLEEIAEPNPSSAP